MSPAKSRAFPTRWIGLLEPKRGVHGDATFFVSYCRKDAARVLPLIKKAKKQRHSFWIDTVNLPPGGRWSGDIVAAIRQCRAMLVFCSRSAFASNDVLREVAMAGRYDKPILPILLDDAQMSDAFLYYLSIHEALRVCDSDWDERFSAALAALSGAPHRPAIALDLLHEL
jgi:hypothetical protein